jgi:hypothetical protein
LGQVVERSPSAQARRKIAAKNQHPPQAGPRQLAPERQPRDLALQRLAADLVARSHGLHRGHIGAICDAITAAGIDHRVVTAAQIGRALNADMSERGQRWPDRIDRPAGFLRVRLSRVAPALAALASATGGSGYAAATSPDDEAEGRECESAPASPPASAAVRAATRARIDQELIARRQLRMERPTTEGRESAAVDHHATTADIRTGDECCAMCGAADAPRRPGMPGRIASVCDRCWDVAGAQINGPEQPGTKTAARPYVRQYGHIALCSTGRSSA